MKKLITFIFIICTTLTTFAQKSVESLTDDDLRELRSKIDTEITDREQKKIGINENLYITVEGGTFNMGNTHTVTINSFIMGVTEVTQELYEFVMSTNPSLYKDKNHPVENVSWYDAVRFCNELSKKDGLTPCYSGTGNSIRCNFYANGYRLPTEAEWEYAARGGMHQSTFTYSGDDIIDEVAWYEFNSISGTSEIATKKANALGLYDMSGNVWEWCWDRYGTLTAETQTNPRGAPTGSYRVTRGGGCNSKDSECTVMLRNSYNPSLHSQYLGFRIVRNAE